MSAGSPVGVRGPLAALTPPQLQGLIGRGDAVDQQVERATAQVIADVRARGDAALFELAARYDLAVPAALEVPQQECRQALAALDPQLRGALKEAAANISAFHRAQLPQAFELSVEPGVRLGRSAQPLDSVGVYVPGGRASYPSSVLMGVIPGRVAGVGQLIVCSPPGPDGRPAAAVLAASALAGADRVFAVGGAGAVAAMALGTQSVPRVDKIVGPGNAYVTEAKRQLNGVVAIDCPAGPSEVLVLADADADPEVAALELLAQAEHDPRAAAVLVAVDDDVADAVEAAVARLLPLQPRQAIARQALLERGAILSAGTLERALEFAAQYAPEHLLLMLRQPRAVLDRVRNAGTVFLGAASSVTFGDYVTGANHTLPTNGLARSYSGLGTLDFLRFTTYQEVSPQAAAKLAPVAARLAGAEGLPAHAAAALARASVATPPPSGTPALRAAYRQIQPYDPQRTPVEVDLSDNTNLFGVNPAAVAALRQLPQGGFSRYPEPYAHSLKQELAELHGVQPQNVTTGGGLDGVIDAALRAFCDPGSAVAFPDPTFGMVELFARMNAARPLPVAVTQELNLDVEALLAARAQVTYVCHPNNPTGKPVGQADLARLARGAAGVLLIDEAYADFAAQGPQRLQEAGAWAAASTNTLLLYTLSKAYGLAGLRVGYAVGPAPLIHEIEKARGPYRVTASAQAAALALLREGREWVADVVRQAALNRARLTSQLQARGLAPLPSQANFVLLPLPADGATNPARALGAALRQQGVAVRAFDDLTRIGPALRVTVAPWPLLERFLQALDQALGHAPKVPA